MTPYRVANTWVDLDVVQSIEATIHASSIGRKQGVWGTVTMAFRNDPVDIDLGQLVYRDDPPRGCQWSVPVTAQPTWDAFIAAWKARPNSQHFS